MTEPNLPELDLLKLPGQLKTKAAILLSLGGEQEDTGADDSTNVGLMVVRDIFK